MNERLFCNFSSCERHSGEPVFGPPNEYRYDVFRDDTDVEYMLKLFGLASRHMYDEFRLPDDVFFWLFTNEVDEHMNGSCGFDVE